MGAASLSDLLRFAKNLLFRAHAVPSARTHGVQFQRWWLELRVASSVTQRFEKRKEQLYNGAMRRRLNDLLPIRINALRGGDWRARL